VFELESLTKVRVLDVRVLSQKDRKPDEHPGAQLLLQATLGAGVLAMFDGFLPAMLYRKPTAKKQGELDGLESAELTPVGEHIKRLPWVYEQTGCEVTIDFGMGGRSNITLSDVKVHRVSMRPEQKGVVIQWTIDAPGLNDTTRGKLTGLKSTDIQMTMTGPDAEDGQGEIEGAGKKPPAAASGTQEPQKQQPADSEGGETDITGRGDNWPFPKDGASGLSDMERSRRAREAEKAQAGTQEPPAADKRRRGRKDAATVIQ
jgi:hypothetical protein